MEFNHEMSPLDSDLAAKITFTILLVSEGFNFIVYAKPKPR